VKGVAHFAMGLAAASCFPAAVRQAAAGHGLLMVLGGVCGLLPDTLDFKWARYFHRCDLQVAPDPLLPDMQEVADAAAHAARRALATGQPCDLRLHTIRLAANRWQSYRVTFDGTRNRVTAQLGATMDTGGRPEARPAAAAARHAPLPCPVRLDYTATIPVDFLDGPTLRIEPDGTEGVRLHFIPWHRRWSHSLLFSLALGAVGAWRLGPTAGAVMAAAHAAHALADQAGQMGGSLLFPLCRRRFAGWGRWRSGQSSVNMATVWLSLLLVFWNLYMASDIRIPYFNPVGLFFWGAAAPWLTFRLVRRAVWRGERPAVGNGRRAAPARRESETT